ncbi:hexameric tyrosine-coordinated heme protein [Planotetraspora sp. GP83]|uniref:hexameric tyrosine-coordinated heme protein n=1 Tax=Planotetraspora sp. GP83 TaxID=3156264 RepID=UPI003513ABF4
MTRVPEEALELIPGGTLITATPAEGRALAIAIVRNTVHNIQPELEALQAGRPQYATDAARLMAATQIVTMEFATIAAANNYWR